MPLGSPLRARLTGLALAKKQTQTTSSSTHENPAVRASATADPSLAQRGACSLLFAFLLFLPYLHILTDGHNRLMLGFSFLGILQIYGILAVAGLAAWLGSETLRAVVRRLPDRIGPWVNRGVRAPFAAFGVCAAIYLVFVHLPWSNFDQAMLQYHLAFKWLWLSCTVLLGLVPGVWTRFAPLASRGLLFLTPLPFVLLFYFWGFPPLSGPPTPAPFGPSSSGVAAAAPVAGTTAAQGPVYLFIFDEWDRIETFEKRSAAEHFPHLAKLLETTTYFAAAKSTNPMTLHSIPNLLFQNELPVRIDDHGRTWFRQENDWVASTTQPSLFQSWERSGGHRVMVGRDLAFTLLLGDQVDWVYQLPFDTGQYLGWREMWAAHLYKASFYGHFPFHRLLGLQGYPERFSVRANDEIHRQTLNTIAHAGPQTVAVFHYLLPHDPFNYTREGLRPNYDQGEPPRAEGYLGNLEYLDEVIGELVASIQKAGHWDNCTLILTADHGTFAGGDERRLDVPLLIKRPGQTAGAVVEEPIRTCDIVGWIERANR